jgi:single-strand DNA-binding protein
MNLDLIGISVEERNMSRGLNKVMIIGRLVGPRDAYTPSGRPVTTYSVATSRTGIPLTVNATETEWFNVVAWGSWRRFANNI